MQRVADVRRVHGVHGADCGPDRDPALVPVEALPRHQSGPRRAALRRWGYLRPAAARSLLCGCRCRREWVQEIWVEEVRVGPAPVFRFALCAASNGRASICACCTCNTVGASAAMPGAVPAPINPHLCDSAPTPLVTCDICRSLCRMLTFFYLRTILARESNHSFAVSVFW